MTAVMPRILILAVVMAAGLPAVAQDPAPAPPLASTSSPDAEKKPADAQAPENSQTPSSASQPGTAPNTPDDSKKDNLLEKPACA